MSACKHEAWEENGSSRVCAQPGCRKSLGPVGRGAHIEAMKARTGEAEVLPADCEGELRDLLQMMRGFFAIPALDAADRLSDIIDRHSGVRPMRTGRNP